MRLGLGPGMRSAVHRRKALGADVRVHLGGAETRVPENLLHSPQVSPAVKQMSCRRVSKSVGARRS